MALHEELLEQPAFRGTRGGALPTLDPRQSAGLAARRVPGRAPRSTCWSGTRPRRATFFFRAPWRPPPPPERIPGVVAHLCHTDAPEEVLERYRERAAIATGLPARPTVAARRDRHRRDGGRVRLPTGRRPVSMSSGREQYGASLPGRSSRGRPRARRDPHRRGAAPVRHLGRRWPGGAPRRAGAGGDARCGRRSSRRGVGSCTAHGARMERRSGRASAEPTGPRVRLVTARPAPESAVARLSSLTKTYMRPVHRLDT